MQDPRYIKISKVKEKEKEIAAALLGIGVAVILWLTVFSRETVIENSLAYRPFHSFSSILSSIKNQGISGNFIGNILIFIPVGFLYPAAFCWGEKKRFRTIIFGFVLSSLIELLQLVFLKGFFDLDDVLLNTLGTLTGFVLNQVLRTRFHKKTS